jgi:hypothetical protein
MNILRYLIQAGPRQLKMMRPVPHDGETEWGVLLPLRGTPWEAFIPVVSGAAHSRALHGDVKDLIRELGRPPYANALKVPLGYRECEQKARCLGAGPHCHPCPKVPECYEPPGLPSREVQAVASMVALAWAENRYVVVVRGPEFSLL